MVSLGKTCKNCEHNCHCSHGGSCRTLDCECILCEHNALDEFWSSLGKPINDINKKKKKY